MSDRLQEIKARQEATDYRSEDARWLLRELEHAKRRFLYLQRCPICHDGVIHIPVKVIRPDKLGRRMPYVDFIDEPCWVCSGPDYALDAEHLVRQQE